MESFFEIITPYSLFTLLALLAAAIVYFIFAKRRHADIIISCYLFLFALVGVFIGAHLLYFIVNLPNWLSQAKGSILTFGDFLWAFFEGAGGLVFYGGLYGAALFIILFCKKFRLDTKSELNHAVLVFPLFHAISRVGCFFAGCCYGIKYTGIFAYSYSKDSIPTGADSSLADFPRFPVQLLEGFLELLIFFLLLYLYIHCINKFSLFKVYILVYGAARFLDEFLRGDAIRGIWGPFSTSQWISLAGILGVLISFFIKKCLKKRLLP